MLPVCRKAELTFEKGLEVLERLRLLHHNLKRCRMYGIDRYAERSTRRCHLDYAALLLGANEAN